MAELAIWYYLVDGERHGPIRESVMRDLLWTGKLPWETLVWMGGLQDWSPAGSELPLASEEPIRIPPAKTRHPLFLAWLILGIVGCGIPVLVYTAGVLGLVHIPGFRSLWEQPVSLVIEAFLVVCIIALARWKRWGFWGIVGGALAGSAMALVLGDGVRLALANLLMPAIWFAVLQVGGQHSAWRQLE